MTGLTPPRWISPASSATSTQAAASISARSTPMAANRALRRCSTAFMRQEIFLAFHELIDLGFLFGPGLGGGFVFCLVGVSCRSRRRSCIVRIFAIAGLSLLQVLLRHPLVLGLCLPVRACPVRACRCFGAGFFIVRLCRGLLVCSSSKGVSLAARLTDSLSSFSISGSCRP